MIYETRMGLSVQSELLEKYFQYLVNQFFKILPIREDEEKTFSTYVQSLQAELVGCKEFVDLFNTDSRFLTLISILQYFISNPKCEVAVVRREVFKAISICNKLKDKFASEVVK